STWTGGDICIAGGSILRIQNALNIAATAGTFNCTDSTSLVQVTQTALVDLAGGTRTWFSPIDNDGQVKLDDGTLTLAAASANNDAGNWNVTATATLAIAADRMLGASAKLGGAGTVVMSGGTTVVPSGATLNPAVLTLSGGVLNLNGTAPATTLP